MTRKTAWIAEVRQQTVITWRESILQDARPDNGQWVQLWDHTHQGRKDNKDGDLAACRQALQDGNFSVCESWVWVL